MKIRVEDVLDILCEGCTQVELTELAEGIIQELDSTQVEQVREFLNSRVSSLG